MAEDKDGDVLTYTLGGTHAESFAIDWATGQLMTKDELDFENTPDLMTGVLIDGERAKGYTVTVRATDPAGIPQVAGDAANSDTVDVNIMVTNVNEPPAISGDAAVPFAEDAPLALVPYMAVDPEINILTIWSVAGDDAGKFSIPGTSGALTFKAQPDYEAPGDANTDNIYEVTVVATDSEGNRGTKAVKVTVANVDEDGVVALSRTQPRVGVEVTASLTDPDGSISGLRWQWYRGAVISLVDSLPTAECDEDTTTNNCPIKDATSDTYTPTAADAAVAVNGDPGATLSAVASYNDGEGVMMKMAVGEAANGVDVDTRNKPPAFGDQDKKTSGTQNETATREVEENTKALATDDLLPDADDDPNDDPNDNVGGPLTATDPDPNMEPLIYTLSGAYAGSFRVRQDNGQIEVGAGAKLDYETKDTMMVTLTAEDSFGASASIMVTITVTDMDEAPEVAGDATAEYAENGVGSVATYTAADPERAAITSWTLNGDDAGLFSIEGGVLSFKKSPNFEEMGTDNMHSVTVKPQTRPTKSARSW